MHEVAVVQKDMPNFFVEAVTVADGRVHTEVREIIVPPEQRVFDVGVKPSAETYLPGQKASVQLKLTDVHGQPIDGLHRGGHLRQVAGVHLGRFQRAGDQGLLLAMATAAPAAHRKQRGPQRLQHRYPRPTGHAAFGAVRQRVLPVGRNGAVGWSGRILRRQGRHWHCWQAGAGGPVRYGGAGGEPMSLG